jgi:hypothetical protein
MNPILAFVSGLVSGLIIGIFGTYFGNRLSEKAKLKDSERDIIKRFQSVKSKMPDLIKEMKNDLNNPEMKTCREFYILTNPKVPFNAPRPAFCYYEAKHDNLTSKIRILELDGFVHDIAKTTTPKYQFDEEFVNLLNTDE